MTLLQDRIDEPLHLGPMVGPSAVGAVGNPACGDVVTLYLRIDEGTIQEASFESIGSKYQLATASVLCDCVVGQRIDEARARTPHCVLEKLPDLPDRNRYLAHLAIDALRRALDRFEKGTTTEHEDLAELNAEDGQNFVMTLLAARPMGTLEVEAMVAADGSRLPGGAARFLSKLRRAGLIKSAMSDDRRSWRWSIIDPEAPATSQAT